MDVWDKLRHMADNNMDIKLSALDQIVEVKTAKGGGHVIIGVPASVVHDFARGKRFVGGLILASKEEFDALDEEADAE